MPTTSIIVCPKCLHEFNVEEALSQKLEEKYRREFAATIKDLETRYEEKQRHLSVREQQLKENQAGLDAEVERRLKSETATRSKEIQQRIEMEFQDQVEALNEQASRAAEEIRALKATQAENIRLKRELEGKEQELAVQFEARMTEQLKEATTSIQIRETERIALKLRERDTLIEALRKQVDEMQRKAEQGSIQLQGEALELELEDFLRQEFPFDLVEEVGKGIKGADVIQAVRNRLGMDCGKIIFESKRTKSFSMDWIPKLKADAVMVKADLCVIVTETLPANVERIGQIDGVWICTFAHAKGLVLVLRDSLVRINEAYGSQANKGEKMQMLYDYLTGTEFRLQVEAIVDGFTSLQTGYLKERAAMERIWKEREKQLQKVLLNTNHFIGSIKGIAGSTMENVRLLAGKDGINELGSKVEG